MLDAISGFGGALFSMLDTAVSSSDRRQANELNYWATMDTNKTNANINESQLAAARENWLREQQNFEQQRKWALEDRDYENWYNLPKNVRDRYLQAGINPALAMQGSGSGLGAPSASTKQAPSPQFGSPPSSLPMQAAHFEPTYTGGLGLAVQKGLDYLLMAEKQEADISRIRTQNDLDTIETLSKIKQRDWQNKELSATVDNILYDLRYKKLTESDRVNNLKYVNDSILADNAYKSSLTALTDAERVFKLDENNRAWMQLKQFIANSISQISLNASQAHKNYQDAATSFQSELNQLYNNSKFEELYKANKAQMDQLLIKLKYETSMQGFKDLIKTFQGFIPLGGMW